MTETIRARTRSERRAYCVGWANAILLINDLGMQAAAEELKLMSEEFQGDWETEPHDPSCRCEECAS